ncbi:hypothetical protein MKZ38_002853 [Zalerion maritima]|uniref:F-box domain-containing protein n=1 Tax=Zalerion maritima TaxID=339359 RepID=A0AAD5S4Y8_9PEZI|nr:hypothetical protein MKZ38_002853 [Zalerion maritima]
MASASLLSLPLELVGHIISQLATLPNLPSLLALATTCRRLHELATPHVYRNFNINLGDGNWFSAEHDVSYVFLRLRTLMERPELGRHVRFLQVIPGSGEDYWKLGNEKFKTLMDKAAEIEGVPPLREWMPQDISDDGPGYAVLDFVMARIQDVEKMRLGAGYEYWPTRYCSREVGFEKLKTLAINHGGTEGGFDLACLKGLLHRAPNLRQVVLSECDRVEDLSWGEQEGGPKPVLKELNTIYFWRCALGEKDLKRLLDCAVPPPRVASPDSHPGPVAVPSLTTIKFTHGSATVGEAVDDCTPREFIKHLRPFRKSLKTLVLDLAESNYDMHNSGGRGLIAGAGFSGFDALETLWISGNTIYDGSADNTAMAAPGVWHVTVHVGDGGLEPAQGNNPAGEEEEDLETTAENDRLLNILPSNVTDFGISSPHARILKDMLRLSEFVGERHPKLETFRYEMSVARRNKHAELMQRMEDNFQRAGVDVERFQIQSWPESIQACPHASSPNLNFFSPSQPSRNIAAYPARMFPIHALLCGHKRRNAPFKILLLTSGAFLATQCAAAEEPSKGSMVAKWAPFVFGAASWGPAEKEPPKPLPSSAEASTSIHDQLNLFLIVGATSSALLVDVPVVEYLLSIWGYAPVALADASSFPSDEQQPEERVDGVLGPDLEAGRMDEVELR